MNGRVYSAQFNNVTVTAVQDLFELVAGATVCAELLSLHLSQQTEVADAEEEMLPLVIRGITGAFTSGSGGAAAAEIPTHLGNAASDVAVETNNTTKITGGTAVIHHAVSWNLRVPLDIIWIPETRIWISPTDALTVSLEAAPADTLDMDGTIYWREVGGS